MSSSMFFYAYFIFYMSLPLLAQWRWGWRGAVIATVAALIFVATSYYYIHTYVAFEPTPANWNPEAKAEREVFGAFALALIALYMPAAAVLAGAVLATILALLRFAIHRLKRGPAV